MWKGREQLGPMKIGSQPWAGKRRGEWGRPGVEMSLSHIYPSGISMGACVLGLGVIVFPGALAELGFRFLCRKDGTSCIFSIHRSTEGRGAPWG